MVVWPRRIAFKQGFAGDRMLVSLKQAVKMYTVICVASSFVRQVQIYVREPWIDTEVHRKLYAYSKLLSRNTGSLNRVSKYKA